MSKKTGGKASTPIKRRLFLLFGGIALLYPIFRFLGYHVARQPQIIEVKAKLSPRGFYVAQEFILFVDKKKAWAVSRSCTHLGCKINYQEKNGFLECPCHQSRVTSDGLVIHGPAKESLPIFTVEKTDAPDTYIVTI